MVRIVMLKLASVCSTCLLLAVSVRAEDWPQFRGPTANGVSSASRVPIVWNSTDHVVWKTPIPGGGWSSPVLAEGRLYLTTAVTDETDTDVSLRALCID